MSDSTVQVLGAMADAQEDFDRVLTAIEDGDCSRARREFEKIDPSERGASVLRRQVQACSTSMDGVDWKVGLGAAALLGLVAALWYFQKPTSAPPSPGAGAPPSPNSRFNPRLR